MISDRLTERTAEMGRNIQEMRSHVRELAHEQLGRLRCRASGYLEEGRRRASRLGRSMESEIRHHPVRWLAISLAVGIAIALVGISAAREHR